MDNDLLFQLSLVMHKLSNSQLAIMGCSGNDSGDLLTQSEYDNLEFNIQQLKVNAQNIVNTLEKHVALK